MTLEACVLFNLWLPSNYFFFPPKGKSGQKISIITFILCCIIDYVTDFFLTEILFEWLLYCSQSHAWIPWSCVKSEKPTSFCSWFELSTFVLSDLCRSQDSKIVDGQECIQSIQEFLFTLKLPLGSLWSWKKGWYDVTRQNSEFQFSDLRRTYFPNSSISDLRVCLTVGDAFKPTRQCFFSLSEI